MLKRYQIQVLREAGHSQEETAKLAGVGKRSVERIEKERPITEVNVSAEVARRRIGRPPKAEAFRSFVLEQFAKEEAKPETERQELLSVELLRRAKLKGYIGAKTAFYALVALVRPKRVRPLVRFEGLPGEFSQHDFGQVDVTFDDGSKKRIHFFASRLKYSRWAQVTIVPNERVETLVRTLLDHFTAWGGRPLLAVFDRPKTVALTWKSDGTVTEWNPTFAQVTLQIGVGVEVCWPRRGQEKGSVENIVGWVKGSFFKQRRFHDEADLLAQLGEWLQDANTQRPCRATKVIPAERMKEERPRLRPLNVTPDDLALRYPIQVGPTGMVLHDTREYSMPPDAMGLAGTLWIYRDRVRIVAGRFESLHPTLPPHGKSKLPEHRAQMLAAVSGKRGRRYMMRQNLLETGNAAQEYLTEITHRRPREWISEIEGLHELLQTFGPDAMNSAFTHAVNARTFGVEYVENYITQIIAGTIPRAAQGRLL